MSDIFGTPPPFDQEAGSAAEPVLPQPPVGIPSRRPLDVRGFLEERQWVSDDEGNWKNDVVTEGEWVEEDEALAAEGVGTEVPPAE